VTSRHGPDGPGGDGPPVWVIRPGKGALLREAFERDALIAVSQADVGDLTGAGKDTILALVRHSLGADSAKVIQVAGMLRRFAVDMQIGDWILMAGLSDGSFRVGVVSGAYNFDPLVDDPDFAHTRSVRWLGVLAKNQVPSEATRGLNAPQALFQPAAQAHLRGIVSNFRF
jgi:restriction system protein